MYKGGFTRRCCLRSLRLILHDYVVLNFLEVQAKKMIFPERHRITLLAENTRDTFKEVVGKTNYDHEKERWGVLHFRRRKMTLVKGQWRKGRLRSWGQNSFIGGRVWTKSSNVCSHNVRPFLVVTYCTRPAEHATRILTVFGVGKLSVLLARQGGFQVCE